MAKRQEITKIQVEAMEVIRKQNKNKNVQRRLKALLMYAEGKKRNDIALETGYAPTYIAQLVKRLKIKGLEHIVGNNYTGNHRLLSFEEEKKILKPFINEKESGEDLVVSEIQKAYEKAIGRQLNSNGHIYQVLKRHGIGQSIQTKNEVNRIE